MVPAKIIPLQYWMDPQGEIVLSFSERKCEVRYNCWEDAGVDATYGASLSFARAIAARSRHAEYSPYQAIGASCPSCIFEVENSPWRREIEQYERDQYGERALDRSYLRHFVVAGHDVYHEILAAAFTEEKAGRIPEGAL